MMKRDDALRIIAGRHNDGIVVPVYQSAFDWMGIRPHDLNYLCTGAMGQASSHALGLALACPDETIVVLDGDGSLLMNLASLVTIVNARATNMVHFVCYNGLYEVNGAYPVPGRGIIDFSGIARSCGFPSVFEFDDTATFGAGIDAVFEAEGPVFVTLKVEAGEAYPRDYEAIHSAQSRATFRQALQTRLGIA